MTVSRVFLSLVSVGFIAFAGLQSLRVVSGATALYHVMRGDAVGDRVPMGVSGLIPKRLQVVDTAGMTREVRLDGARVLVFVYDARCSVCNQNTPRWLDLVAAARQRYPDIAVYAMPLTIDTVPSNRGYWRGFDRAIEPIQPVDAAQALLVAGLSATPATIVLREGHRVASHVGLLGDHRRAFLMRKLD